MKNKTKIRSTLITATLLCVTLAGPAMAQTAPSWGTAKEGTFAVTSLLFCREVKDREPEQVDFAPSANGERIYAYLKLFNKGEERQVKITWKLAGKNFHHITLNVGRSARYRTWAYMTLDEAKQGPWTVEVRDDEGTMLAVMPFMVLAPDKAKANVTLASLTPDAKKAPGAEKE